MNDPSPRLIEVFRELAEHTRPKCASCRSPFSCCRPEHCETTRDMALEFFGVSLEETGHPTLPFMGPGGCTVAPHLRPVCSVHTCGIGSFGSSGDTAWDQRYWELRGEADDLLIEQMELVE